MPTEDLGLTFILFKQLFYLYYYILQYVCILKQQQMYVNDTFIDLTIAFVFWF